MNQKEFLNRKIKIIGEGHYKRYAVLAPIIKENDNIYLLFEKRSAALNHQPGEICFPGGKQEENESLEECAVRETVEELCIDSGQIKILGPGDIFVSPFNLIIYPYIGIISGYQGTFSTQEVAEIIKIPLEFFQNNEPEKYRNALINQPEENFPYDKIPGGDRYPWAKGSYDILFYHYKEHIIWGLTARIVQSTVELINKYHLISDLL